MKNTPVELVDAISDEQVCQSLSTSTALVSCDTRGRRISLISSRASGSSFLNILGVEEQSGLHWYSPVSLSMSVVEQLQTLAEKMNSTLRSEQIIRSIGAGQE